MCGWRRRSALRIVLWVLLLGSLGLAATACGESNPDVPGVTITTPVPTATPEAPGPQDFAGFAFPIAGGCLPTSDNLMPNAERPYRRGIHEGVDFYDCDNCTPIAAGTEVLAVKAGQVIRADLDYQELTFEELNELYARIDELGECDDYTLDRFRGRQVWIDHGKGIVTRYAHLGGIAPGIRPGVEVEAGEVVGYVGDSGTPESVTNPGTENHLHFEIRVGEAYLGQGLPPEETRALYETAFSPYSVPISPEPPATTEPGPEEDA
jgi:murein DD-endopeptidase MepM/ murein hydrolase activator NlpD